MKTQSTHKHVLGDCPHTRKKNDALWVTLTKIWNKLGAKTIQFQPWFTTSNKRRAKWSLSEELCNKGLIPKEMIAKIKKYNKKLNTKLLKHLTALTIRKHILKTYSERQKLVQKILTQKQPDHDEI